MQVLRAVAGAHLDVEPDEVVRGEIEPRAEALDLQRPRQLPPEAVGDAFRRDDEKRKECEEDDAGSETQADQRLPPPRRRQT